MYIYMRVVMHVCILYHSEVLYFGFTSGCMCVCVCVGGCVRVCVKGAGEDAVKRSG